MLTAHYLKIEASFFRGKKYFRPPKKQQNLTYSRHFLLWMNGYLLFKGDLIKVRLQLHIVSNAYLSLSFQLLQKKCKCRKIQEMKLRTSKKPCVASLPFDRLKIEIQTQVFEENKSPNVCHTKSRSCWCVPKRRSGFFIPSLKRKEKIIFSEGCQA